jgi:hypothetical protein
MTLQIHLRFLILGILGIPGILAISTPQLALGADSSIATPQGQQQESHLEQKNETPNHPVQRYNPNGKPDPFKPLTFGSIEQSSALGGDGTALSESDLSTIRLVGTALGTEMSAIIMADRQGHIAKVGDKVGRGGGRLIAITNSKIVIRMPLNTAELQRAGASQSFRQRFRDIIIPIDSNKQKEVAAAPSTPTPNSPPPLLGPGNPQ